MTQKILIIGPAWVGDTVMAQCLFKLLKRQHPDALLDILAPAWTFPLLTCMPEINKAIEIPVKSGELKLLTRYRLAKTLAQHQYDQAIVLPNSFKSALIPWIAKIPKRTGWVGEWRYGLLNDIRRLDKARYPLMIDRYMALGLKPGVPLPPPDYPQFEVTANARQALAEKYQLSLSKPILALCPGAAFGRAKRWPEKYFAAVANQQYQQGWEIWVFGSPADQPAIEKILALAPQCQNVSGKPLNETITLLANTTGVISNDSGLLHVAAALAKPVVAIYGPTSPSFTPPLSKLATVLQLSLPCQPCFQRECPEIHHRCMLDLTPAQVLSAIAHWK